MVRPRKIRRTRFSPDVTYFKPRGVPLSKLREVSLEYDEFEAICLRYTKELDQHSCAKKMKISQSTFQRILASANQKIANALVQGLAIRIDLSGTLNGDKS